MSAGTKAEQIRALARTRVHKLSPDMADGRSGRNDLSDEAATGILAYLTRCPEIKVPEATVTAKPAPRELPPGLGAFKGTIPDGWYATPREGSETIDYWKIELHAKKDKWEGLSFARRVLGGQSRDAQKLRTERIDTMQQRLAMQAITEYGLEESQQLFADTLERCIDCSTPLTDPISRAERRGPHCRAKHAGRR